jgi:hypothetical protein
MLTQNLIDSPQSKIPALATKCKHEDIGTNIKLTTYIVVGLLIGIPHSDQKNVRLMMY